MKNFNDGQNWQINFTLGTQVSIAGDVTGNGFCAGIITSNSLPDSNSLCYWSSGAQTRPEALPFWRYATGAGGTPDSPSPPFSNLNWSVKINPSGLVSFYQNPNAQGTPYRTISLDTNKPWYWAAFENDFTSAGLSAGNNTLTLTNFSAVSNRSTITSGTANTDSSSCLKYSGSLSGSLYTWDASTGTWSSITASNASTVIKTDKPTVVIAHGWNDGVFDASSGTVTGWIADMAETLHLQNSDANILAWDWHTQAVSVVGLPAIPILVDIPIEGLDGAERSALRGGIAVGTQLANELKTLGIHNNNLQLIGHSNGGAVVGQAAYVLSSSGGGPVERITTLDVPRLLLGEVPLADIGAALGYSIDVDLISPDKLLRGVDASRFVRINTATEVEAYYSNGIAGRLSLGFGAPLNSASNVFNGRVYPGGALQVDHLRIPDWYTTAHGASPGPDEYKMGITRSILSPTGTLPIGTYTEQGYPGAQHAGALWCGDNRLFRVRLAESAFTYCVGRVTEGVRRRASTAIHGRFRAAVLQGRH